jgi:hypothetical protein
VLLNLTMDDQVEDVPLVWDGMESPRIGGGSGQTAWVGGSNVVANRR